MNDLVSHGRIIASLPVRHYSPKTKRPNSSPSRLDSTGSFEMRKRSASSKKARSFCLLASIPNSISSTRMRLSLNRRRCAIDSTCLAIGPGRVTLRRTPFGLANPRVIAAVAAVALSVHLFVLFYEEPTLRKKFGADYEEYCRNVRRWWPRVRGWDKS